MIALQQPVTTDLRTIITIMKASSDLERMGDHAVSVAKSTIRLKGLPRILEVEKEINEMSNYVKKWWTTCWLLMSKQMKKTRV